MKTKLLAVLSFLLLGHFAQASETLTTETRYPQYQLPSHAGDEVGDIRVVVSQKRIWFIADEMPMKCLKTQVKNAEGKAVIEKCFTSKCADWFLNIEALPKGDYTLHLGDRVEKFKK